MRFAICDNCGAKDDAAYKPNHPILVGGVLLQFRQEDGDDEMEAELELCEECRNELLKAFPKLKAAIRYHKGEADRGECEADK